MKTGLRRVVAMFAAALLASVGPAWTTTASALGCSVVTYDEAVAAATDVFDGIVLQSEPGPAGGAILRFDVLKVVKGKVGDPQDVTSVRSDAAFEVGLAYRVFANRSAAGLTDDPCSTRLLLGYRLAAADGGVFAFGASSFHGSAARLRLRSPVVGMASTPSGHGYWLVAADGGVFAYGDARFFGSAGGLRLAARIVGLTPTPSGGGYWLVGADGGVFAYGDARFFGSPASLRLASPVVGIAATGSGSGYWLAGRDGGVFAYGDAGYFGNSRDIVAGAVAAPRGTGITASHSGTGYWMSSDIGIEGFGDTEPVGPTWAIALSRIISVALPTTNTGVAVTDPGGCVFVFNLRVVDDMCGDRLNAPIVAISP
jgi:hypothetical protein